MKKHFYITDILLIVIATIAFGLLTYEILNTNNLRESISKTCFVISTILSGFKGFELNKLIKKEKYQKSLNFFEYCEEELKTMMERKRINILLFLPIYFNFSREELKKQQSRVNRFTYGMYLFILLSIIL